MESPAEVVLRDLIQHYCSNFLYENAKFFAERLYYGNPASDPALRSEYLFLLAKCYHGQGKTRQVYHLLKEDKYLPNRYLFAQSCISLGKYPEAEKALFPFKNVHPNDITESDLAFIPGGAAGLYLLGMICRQEQRKDYAVAYFQQTIKFDKNCWIALCALCEMGVSINTEAMFGVAMSSAVEAVRASQEPMSTAHSLPASTTATTRREKEANALTSNDSGVGGGKGDALKFQRGHVMERRHIAEHLGDPHHTPPNSAMSLGMSSLALRVGFATPGCMPSSSPMDNYSSYAGGGAMQQLMAGGGGSVISFAGPVAHSPPSSQIQQSHMQTMNSFSNYSSSAPLSAMGGGDGDSKGYRTVTRPSDIRQHGGMGGGNNLFASPDSLLHSPNNGNGRECREHCLTNASPDSNRPGLLFDTPGLTPIAGRQSVGGGDFSMHAAAYPMSLERGSNNSSGLSLPPPPSVSEEEERERYLHVSRGARGGGGGGDESKRRVSFGPSTTQESPLLLPRDGEKKGGKKKKIAARLSFSSAGKSVLASEGSSQEEEEEEDSVLQTDQAPPEKFQRLKDCHDHEEYDFDTPRVGSSGGERGGREGGLTSPRDMAQSLYDRVQQQQLQQQTSIEHITPAPPKPKPVGARTIGKASRIPVPNRSRAPQFHAPCSITGGHRDGDSHASPPRSVHITVTPGKSVTSHSRQAAGRGGGRSSGGDRSPWKQHDYDSSGGRRGDLNEASVTQQQQQQQQEQQRRQYQECLVAGQALVSSIISVFGYAYYLLCQYQCTACIRHLQQLPRRHYSCGWVQHTLGRAYFELNDYKAALLALREMLRLEPFRVKGTEILSTTLWHLKREKELCALSQQVAEIDKLSPETWCVVGNCFSLQKEHDTALKFFARSIQIDPSFTYAHTLSGHEYICNEDLDKAQASFRDAIFHDDRHYNAWYGLGTIYLRQERIELAEYHFKRAISIHPTSSVLQTFLGMVLNAYDRLDKNAEAISVLRQACKYDAHNSMLFFQLAHVLQQHGSLEHLEEALAALHVVREYAPKEPPVYSALGEVCHKLGRNQEALQHFNTAINLDYKQAAILKPILDAIQDPYLNAGGN